MNGVQERRQTAYTLIISHKKCLHRRRFIFFANLYFFKFRLKVFGCAVIVTSPPYSVDMYIHYKIEVEANCSCLIHICHFCSVKLKTTK